MSGSKQAYSVFSKLVSVFMIVTLLWLTVSLPFVNESRQRIAAGVNHSTGGSGQSDDGSNPFGNTTEEKNPGANSIAEEFLHEHHSDIEIPMSWLLHDNCGHVPIYVAFHGELLSPPPEA